MRQQKVLVFISQTKIKRTISDWALCTMPVMTLMCSVSVLESKGNIKSKFLTYRAHGAEWFATQASVYFGFYIL